MDRTAEQISAAHAAVEARYNRTWHQTRVYATVFEPGGACRCTGCPHPAVRRITANVWGTAFECDVCEGHSELDGCLLESLPEGPPKRKTKFDELVDALDLRQRGNQWVSPMLRPTPAMRRLREAVVRVQRRPTALIDTLAHYTAPFSDDVPAEEIESFEVSVFVGANSPDIEALATEVLELLNQTLPIDDPLGSLVEIDEPAAPSAGLSQLERALRGHCVLLANPQFAATSILRDVAIVYGWTEQSEQDVRADPRYRQLQMWAAHREIFLLADLVNQIDPSSSDARAQQETLLRLAEGHVRLKTGDPHPESQTPGGRAPDCATSLPNLPG